MSNFQNFKIGKEIKTLLLDSSTLCGYVGNSVFPLVANNGTKFPFLIYKRTSYQDDSNKDYQDEIVYVSIQIVSQKYEQSVDIATLVANILVGKATRVIDDIQLVGISEDFIDDSYVQTINFKIFLR